MDSETEAKSNKSKLLYNETMIVGHYSTSKLRFLAKGFPKLKLKVNAEESEIKSEKPCFDRFKSYLQLIFTKFDDFIFLTLLGLSVAILSFLIDVFCEICQKAHLWLYYVSSFSIPLQYLVWILFPIILITCSSGFSHFVSPLAFGSGIPEVKTMLKGIKISGFLTTSAFISKIVGLTLSLGSGMPLGKLGPFVHVGSAVAKLLSQLFPRMKKTLGDSFYAHIITAGAAVGVSCIFATPIGGVMFSIEATATIYAIRNYWRGFYAAMIGAISFRIMTSWYRNEETIMAFYKSTFNRNAPYDAKEIFIFILLGAVCGIFGAGFVFLHRNVVLLTRKKNFISSLVKLNRLIYPTVITLVTFTVLFPPGLGQYMAGQLTLRDAVNQMFDNRTWSIPNNYTISEEETLRVWKGPTNNVFLVIFLFFLSRFFFCAISTTMPVPCGVFIPAFSLGAGFGRLIGELMAFYFPRGMGGGAAHPGVYAIIGAASLSGAMSHTVSPAVVAFEMTGYLGHIIPCVISVCVAGTVANFLQPSLYDAMIKIKKLTFLPPVINSMQCNANERTAEDILIREIQCVHLTNTIEELLNMVSETTKEYFPVLRSPESPVFIGSVTSKELLNMILNENVRPITSVHEEQRRISLSHPAPTRRASRFSISKVTREELDDVVLFRNEPNGNKISEKTKMLQLSYEKYLDLNALYINKKLPLFKVHQQFSLLNLDHVFVTDKGYFVGIITIREVLEAINSSPKDEVDINKEFVKLLKLG